MIAWSLLKCQNRCVAPSMKDSVNITADRQSFISLSYQEYPCGVFLRAWNQWGLGFGLTKEVKKKEKSPPTSITRRMCANICAVFKSCTRCRWPTSMPERTPKPRSPRASSSSLSRRNSGNVRIWCDGCQRLSERFCWLCTANKQLEFTFCVVICKFRPEAVSKVWAEAMGDIGLQLGQASRKPGAGSVQENRCL